MTLFADKEKEKDYVLGDESGDEKDEELHESDHAKNVECDKENPPLIVGSTYPNMDEFKLAIRQHAVKREFDGEEWTT